MLDRWIYNIWNSLVMAVIYADKKIVLLDCFSIVMSLEIITKVRVFDTEGRYKTQGPKQVLGNTSHT